MKAAAGTLDGIVDTVAGESPAGWVAGCCDGGWVGGVMYCCNCSMPCCDPPLYPPHPKTVQPAAKHDLSTYLQLLKTNGKVRGAQRRGGRGGGAVCNTSHPFPAQI